MPDQLGKFYYRLINRGDRIIMFPARGNFYSSDNITTRRFDKGKEKETIAAVNKKNTIMTRFSSKNICIFPL